MTYKKIQECYQIHFGRSIKSCWIADIKRELGLPIRIAYNRINNDSVKNPCPEGIIKERLKKIITADTRH